MFSASFLFAEAKLKASSTFLSIGFRRQRFPILQPFSVDASNLTIIFNLTIEFHFMQAYSE